MWQTGAELDASAVRSAAVEKDQSLDVLACTGRPAAWDSDIISSILIWSRHKSTKYLPHLSDTWSSPNCERESVAIQGTAWTISTRTR